MAKTKSNSKRKTRSDKFPLTLHPTGQYCKKIKGKLYYFGTDKKLSLRRYLEQAAYLHTGRTLPKNFANNGITPELAMWAFPSVVTYLQSERVSLYRNLFAKRGKRQNIIK